MPFDIVFPDENEHEFLEMAKKLGYNELLFVYEMGRRPLPKPVVKDVSLKVRVGLLASPKQVQKAKQLCPFVLVRSSPDDREVIERKCPQMIFELENQRRKDPMHLKNSGLNQVLCALLGKNRISVGLSLHLVLTSTTQQKIRILGRMIQNIRLCKKYKVETMFASFAKSPMQMRNPHDMEAFSRCLGLRNLGRKSTSAAQ